MSRIVGIVQPHEGISVAEQIYLIESHAREEGVEVDGFAGSDDILRAGEPATQVLMSSIASAETGSIVFVDGIADKIPECVTRLCRECGCRMLVVDRQKSGLGLA